MYSKLNITENHLRALALFTNGYDKKYYIREVQKLLKISPRTAQLVLGDLEDKTVLKSETKGKIREYSLRSNQTTIDYLVFVEQYKKMVFLEGNPLIKEVIIKATPYFKGICLIFGSYAKGRATKESDLDLLIIGDYDKKSVKRVAKNYGVNLSIKKYTEESFIKGLKSNDLLLKEVLNHHIILLKVEEFVKRVMA